MTLYNFLESCSIISTNTTLEVKIENGNLVVFHKIYGTTRLKQKNKLISGCNPGWLRNFTFIKKDGEVNGFELPINEYEKITFLKQ